MLVSYYAIFMKENNEYLVRFPNLPGCVSCGKDFETAQRMGKEAMELYLDGLDVKAIPNKTEPPYSDYGGAEIALIETELEVRRGKLHIAKERWMESIVNAFPENQNYLFEVCGIDVNRLIEDVKSDTYLLKVDERKKLAKELPRLYLLSHNREDVDVFARYIGSFNEGYMYFYILKNGNVPLSDEDAILDFVEKNKLVTVEVEVDGDVLHLSGDGVERRWKNKEEH